MLPWGDIFTALNYCLELCHFGEKSGIFKLSVKTQVSKSTPVQGNVTAWSNQSTNPAPVPLSVWFYLRWPWILLPAEFRANCDSGITHHPSGREKSLKDFVSKEKKKSNLSEFTASWNKVPYLKMEEITALWSLVLRCVVNIEAAQWKTGFLLNF